MLFSSLPAGGQTAPLAWMNAVRSAVGAPALRPDALLSRTADLWAARLAQAGVLSHRGTDGSSVLDRYRALGGTEVRVGEILGAGPDLIEIEKGWMKSDEHRRLLLDPVWTHAGWGKADSPRAAGGEIWVVVFCRKLVEDLQVATDGTTLHLSGRFIAATAARGLLLAGLQTLEPSEWTAATHTFSFSVADAGGYFRLGFLTADGSFTLTNAFTWPPGRESPGGPDRFSTPAASP
jgi:hypothetical protein